MTRAVVSIAALVSIASALSLAQSADPRASLKAGFRDAGIAARHMTLVTTVGKPEGFFDPQRPAGVPSAAEPATGATPAPRVDMPPTPPPGAADGLAFANSDLAFRNTHLFMGNFHGFTAYDIENASRPRLLASIVCPGGQGDVSVHGNLLFMSVEQTRGRVDCGVQGVAEPVSAERFRGVRIFDITDLAKPRQVAAQRVVGRTPTPWSPTAGTRRPSTSTARAPVPCAPATSSPGVPTRAPTIPARRALPST